MAPPVASRTSTSSEPRNSWARAHSANIAHKHNGTQKSLAIKETTSLLPTHDCRTRRAPSKKGFSLSRSVLQVRIKPRHSPPDTIAQVLGLRKVMPFVLVDHELRFHAERF